jgi:hypothetical protein
LQIIFYNRCGGSTWTCRKKPGESELDAIYRLDGEMIELAGRFSDAIRKLAAASAVAPNFDVLADSLSQIESLITKRADLLKGYRE